MEFNHVPVLLNECMNALAIKPDGIYVDGTAGGGGHSEAIAKKLAAGRLISIDKDPDAVNAASERLKTYRCAQVVRGDFMDTPLILNELGIEKADGVLLDLGVSSYQFDTPERGFSYNYDAPLDMRMSGEGKSAFDVVNGYSVNELCRVLRDYGEEKFAMRIARKIEEARLIKPVESTFELVELIKAGIPAAARREGGHPAKRSFQAIRIEVNGELEGLKNCLDEMFECLKPGGRFAIITFHSLEDRIVKQNFAGFCKGCVCPPDFPICVCGKTPRARSVTRKPVTAGEKELAENNRSHSAKLRAVEKTEEKIMEVNIHGVRI